MTNTSATCPICDGVVSLTADVEVSEVVTCSDCSNRLVVVEKTDKGVKLQEAPEVEEDWGQ